MLQLELQLSRVSQVRHGKKDHGQIPLLDAISLGEFWAVVLGIVYYLQSVIKVLLVKETGDKTSSSKLYKDLRQIQKQPMGQREAEAST